MNIKVRINQAESLRRGIDSPESITRLNINPADLSEEDRETLSAICNDGYDATGGLRWEAAGCAAYTRPLTLPEPTIDGLVEALEAARANREIAMQEARRREQDNQTEARKALVDLMAAPAEERTVWLDIDGTATSWESLKVHEVTYQHQPTTLGGWDWRVLPSDDRARYEAWEQEQSAGNARRKTEAIEAAHPVIERIRAERAAQAERVERERAHAISALPEITRQRLAAGLASTEEINRLIRDQARAQHGLSWMPHTHCAPAESVTDDQFARLQAITRQYSHIDGLSVTPASLSSYRPANEWDDPEDIDGDNEVLSDGPYLVALLKWPVAGLDVKAHIPLD